MTVYESDIPGVGKKFEYELDDGSRLIALIHHSGRRELFHRQDEDADSEKIADLTDSQAREFGSILEGAYFQPVATENLSVPLGGAVIEWRTVPAGSPLDGGTLADADVRHETGVNVIAIQRDDETLPNPDSETELRADDVLVALGTRQEHADLKALLQGE